MRDLLELAAACEAATGPDEYELIRDSWVAIHGDEANWHPFIDILGAGGGLSAAMTLVPEGWHLALYSPGQMGGHLWYATLDPPKFDHDHETQSDAATPALALCAAALKARAAIPSAQGEG